MQFFNMFQGGLKTERIDSKGLLGVNLTGGRRVNVDGVGRAARGGRIGALSSSSKGNFKNNRARAGTSRGAYTNGKGGRFSPTGTSGGVGASITDIVDEVSSSELVKQLH